MKGDIAVAGLMITAEEWQALDSASRAQVVAVITREQSTSNAVVAPAILAEGTSPSIDVPDGHDAPEAIEELPSSAVAYIDPSCDITVDTRIADPS